MGNVVSLRSHQHAIVNPSVEQRELLALNRALQYIQREANILGESEAAIYIGCAAEIVADRLLCFGIVTSSSEATDRHEVS